MSSVSRHDSGDGEIKSCVPQDVFLDWLDRLRKITITRSKKFGKSGIETQICHTYSEVTELYEAVMGEKGQVAHLNEVWDIIFSAITCAQVLGYTDKEILNGMEKCYEKILAKARPDPTIVRGKLAITRHHISNIILRMVNGTQFYIDGHPYISQEDIKEIEELTGQLLRTERIYRAEGNHPIAVYPRHPGKFRESVKVLNA